MAVRKHVFEGELRVVSDYECGDIMLDGEWLVWLLNEALLGQRWGGATRYLVAEEQTREDIQDRLDHWGVELGEEISQTKYKYIRLSREWKLATEMEPENYGRVRITVEELPDDD